jgi:DNA-binding transcriptional LysR family regulator
LNDIKKPINHYQKNKLEQMECFFLVAKHGTISESTKHSFYSASTISMQINSFEYDLQIKLFDKTNKKWILTKKAEQIYKLVNDIMTTFKQLYDTKKTQIKALPNHNYKKNKIDQMEGFCTVIEHGSIANSEKFGFSKTTLSKQINSLEYDLQTLFFERTTDGLQTNRDGFKTYIKIKKLLNKIYKLYGKPTKPIKNIFYLAFRQNLTKLKKKIVKKLIIQN